ncbi:hypothetical protein [Paraburkholderia sp. DHOC27]|uniref:hypothetical protein n=1 Tax=Paraburkholderia sp. DHOC27 TaxID=2303330 RepID=UPI000E3E17E7|nr:hypothetical protein [Paraburkholderia sp. DHOC27]RFU48365.1 hypothetical protein D0B32_00505 [Paraburkholderia sp. DHOC27]
MNAHFACWVRPVRAACCAATLVTLAACGGNSCIGLDSCGGGGVPPNVSLSGTAATGSALANATVGVSCVQGSGTAVSDSGGHYTIALNATPPCLLTVTSGSTSLHSLAYAGGTFNTTPETELMMVYLASQLGTNENGLIASFQTNAQFQQVLSNQSDVQAAQAAVVTNLQQHYTLTLSTPAFLTTSFALGQAGVASDLSALAAAGAIDANGMPDQVAVSLLSAAGAAHPLP